ncbi:hypothetical protein [Pedobacter gandavensis]|nr:hypothetical protein [Pedobacter gandavensis]
MVKVKIRLVGGNFRRKRRLLHNEVFKKLDAESKLFKVLVIKTNEVIPYTSVFLQLDCGYWNGEKEQQLRDEMRVKK